MFDYLSNAFHCILDFNLQLSANSDPVIPVSSNRSRRLPPLLLNRRRGGGVIPCCFLILDYI
jgi:hypothetical protein